MKRMQVSIAGLFIAGIIGAVPTPGQASHEPFALFEDWSKPTIRSDRWRGNELFGGHEIKRQVESVGRKKALAMRYRREGFTISDVGTSATLQSLNFTNPTTIDQIEAEFQVQSVAVTGCAANPTPSDAQAARLGISRFNDGSSTGPGDRTGDHFGIILARRRSDSADPPGVLEVAGVLGRCPNAPCLSPPLVSSIILPQTVAVGTLFTLRIIWDQPNHRFLFGVDGNPDVELAYPAALEAAPAVAPFADLSIRHVTANCMAGPTVGDAEVLVFKVRTNTSAVIP